MIYTLQDCKRTFFRTTRGRKQSRRSFTTFLLLQIAIPKISDKNVLRYQRLKIDKIEIRTKNELYSIKNGRHSIVQDPSKLSSCNSILVVLYFHLLTAKPKLEHSLEHVINPETQVTLTSFIEPQLCYSSNLQSVIFSKKCTRVPQVKSRCHRSKETL